MDRANRATDSLKNRKIAIAKTAVLRYYPHACAANLAISPCPQARLATHRNFAREDTSAILQHLNPASLESSPAPNNHV